MITPKQIRALRREISQLSDAELSQLVLSAALNRKLHPAMSVELADEERVAADAWIEEILKSAGV